MSKPHSITGPRSKKAYPSMIDPHNRQQAVTMTEKDPLHPINLFKLVAARRTDLLRNSAAGTDGVECPIVVLHAEQFPTRSHKVGATYSVLIEKELNGEVDPAQHTLVWPSTGNYGIGGAYVGCRMEFESIVILPQDMSQERFELIASYGARVIKTPGCESYGMESGGQVLGAAQE